MTGQLHTPAHQLQIGKPWGKLGLYLYIRKPAHYLLGFGNEIKHKLIVIQIEAIKHPAIRQWWKQLKYKIRITITLKWLYNKLLKG